jgi:hypothetical protein
MGLSSTEQKVTSLRQRLKKRRARALSSGGAALIKPKPKLSRWVKGLR